MSVQIQAQAVPVKESEEEEILRLLERLYSIVRPKPDIHQKVEVLASPRNLLTMSRLSQNQVEFVVHAFWAEKHYPTIFPPLADVARTLLGANISFDGKGREQVKDVMVAEDVSQRLRGVMYAEQPHERRLLGRKGKEKEEEKE